MDRIYVHGYDPRESVRLQDQAETLADLLHSDTSYPKGSAVLEVGCGTGAQTIPLAYNSPGARIISVDISADSVAQAKAKAVAAGLTNVQFQQADIFSLPFGPQSFDHVFICFVLEHLSYPVEALAALKELLRRGGTVTVIEGDHGSAYFHPDSDEARTAHRLPNRAAAGGGRQRTDRATALSVAEGGWLRRGPGFSADGVCGFEPARISWPASPGIRSPR